MFSTQAGGWFAISATLRRVLLRQGWIETTWSNDATASFERDDTGERLWIEAIDAANRETGWPRFVVTEAAGETVTFGSESESDAINYLLS